MLDLISFYIRNHKMHVLFTKGNNIFSRVIRWALRSDISHVAILKDGLVYHSNLKGVHIQPLDRFIDKAKIVKTIPYSIEQGRLLEVISQEWGKPYDCVAFWWLGIRAIFSRAGIKLPKADVRQITGMYICTELVTQVLIGEERQLTPDQLYDMLNKD